MIRFLVPVASLFLLGAPLPVLAQDGAETVPPQSPIVVEKERDPKQKKVCTKVVATGSIMTRRVCKTLGQIEAEQAETQRAVEKMQDAQETAKHTEEQRKL